MTAIAPTQAVSLDQPEMTQTRNSAALLNSSNKHDRPLSRNSEVDIDQHSISQPKNVVEVQRKILAKGKPTRANPIAVNNVFDTVGSNGIFQASPSVVKFAGFEANKTHTLKVRLINNSPAP